MLLLFLSRYLRWARLPSTGVLPAIQPPWCELHWMTKGERSCFLTRNSFESLSIDKQGGTDSLRCVIRIYYYNTHLVFMDTLIAHSLAGSAEHLRSNSIQWSQVWFLLGGKVTQWIIDWILWSTFLLLIDYGLRRYRNLISYCVYLSLTSCHFNNSSYPICARKWLLISEEWCVLHSNLLHAEFSVFTINFPAKSKLLL